MSSSKRPTACQLIFSCLTFISLVYGSEINVFASNSSTISHPPLASESLITKIAFGSCNRHDRQQPLWPSITSLSPDLFIWLGDIVYADSTLFGIPFIRYPGNEEEMKYKYQTQYNRLDYATFRKSFYTIGVWDDHDYGENDGNLFSPVELKKFSQKFFLDFLDEPLNSNRRTQEGVYAHYLFGPPGKRVLIILLDIRYSANPLSDDILGLAQWTWLINLLNDPQLNENPPNLVLLGSGIQFVALNKFVGEAWRSFPRSRSRILNLIGQTLNRWNKLSNQSIPSIWITGDVHLAEITQTDFCITNDYQNLDKYINTDSNENNFDIPLDSVYHVVDFTSSGMTHSWMNQVPLVSKLPIGLGAKLLNNLFFYILWKPQSYITNHEDPSVREFYLDLNFGFIQINWETKTVQLEARSHTSSSPHIIRTFNFDQLSTKPLNPSARPSTIIDDRTHICNREFKGIKTVHFVISGVHTVITILLIVILPCFWILSTILCKRKNSKKKLD